MFCNLVPQFVQNLVPFGITELHLGQIIEGNLLTIILGYIFYHKITIFIYHAKQIDLNNAYLHDIKKENI